jgi:hypothetical protein
VTGSEVLLLSEPARGVLGAVGALCAIERILFVGKTIWRHRCSRESWFSGKERLELAGVSLVFFICTLISYPWFLPGGSSFGAWLEHTSVAVAVALLILAVAIAVMVGAIAVDAARSGLGLCDEQRP